MISAMVLLDRVELAQRAFGGDEWRKDWCKCDPSVGMVPCEYCAVFEALRSTHEYLKNRIEVETDNGK